MKKIGLERVRCRCYFCKRDLRQNEAKIVISTKGTGKKLPVTKHLSCARCHFGNEDRMGNTIAIDKYNKDKNSVIISKI
ncbi:hypothetical protein M1614_01540 [Candidatus Marsarchaeota archaeon]|nr:hypothetical protein [Candidatus Marsarchaeota archaeon]